jgi:hypothetical protein
MDYHLAQINVARMVAPIDDPRMREFVDNLAPINALAESSPGFVWRLQSDASGNATDIPSGFDDPMVIVNMSVWESVEALREFTYKTQHLEFFRKRAAWFEKPVQASYAMWWVPVGHLPTVAEGRERLELYRRLGSTPESFWFSQPFPKPGSAPILAETSA